MSFPCPSKSPEGHACAFDRYGPDMDHDIPHGAPEEPYQSPEDGAGVFWDDEGAMWWC